MKDDGFGWRLGHYAVDTPSSVDKQSLEIVHVKHALDRDFILAALVSCAVHNHGMGKEIGVGDNHSTLIGRSDDGGACLDLFDLPFEGVEFDVIANAKGLGPKQQQSGQEILQDVLKREPDRDTADTQDLDEISRLKRRSDNRKCDQKSEHYHRPACQAFEDQAQVCPSARDSATSSASDKVACGVEGEEDQRTNRESWKPFDESVGHVPG